LLKLVVIVRYLGVNGEMYTMVNDLIFGTFRSVMLYYVSTNELFTVFSVYVH